MTSRELTEEEKRIYIKNKARQEAERKSLSFSIKHEQLMHDEGYLHNYEEKMRYSDAMLDQYKHELEICELAIKDCEDKLQNGVVMKEEK